MTTKSPEQLEDAQMTDVLNTIVALRMKEEKRQALNYVRSRLEPEIAEARLRGREVDIDKFTLRALRLVKEFYARN